MIDIEQLYQNAIRREGVLKEENQRLRELLNFLRPELCVDCYQILYDYEHQEEELSDA